MAAPREPTLADHLASGRWLSLRCLGCSRERVITMWEAAHRYGHDLTVPEVRALIWARCRASKACSASVGLALEHETPKVGKGAKQG